MSLPRKNMPTVASLVGISSLDETPQQQDSKHSSTQQLPTFIPLPVFRFIGPNSPPAESTPAKSSVSKENGKARRNTLASIFFGDSTPVRSSSFSQPESKYVTSPLVTSEAARKRFDTEKRHSLPCATGPLLSPKEEKEPETPVKQLNQLEDPISTSLVTLRVRAGARPVPYSGHFDGDNLSVASMSREGNSHRTKSVRNNEDGLRHNRQSGVADVARMMVPRMINDESELNSHELDLLHFAAEGDLEGLQTLFQEQTYYLFHLNVNCVDSLDRTALSLSTLNHHLDVVKFLLGEDVFGIKLGDALFYAIQCEFIEAIELLLEKDPQTSLQVQPGTTSPFEPGLTPFMLAAHKNNYKILSVLYKYTHRLTFSDNELLQDEGFDPYSWDAVMERLLHYRARASPAFMLLMYNEKGMTWDPLNSSMDLFSELHELARREREVEEAYLQMANRCETFALQLLEEVRSANELADLMRYDLDDDMDDVSELDDPGESDRITPERRQKIRNYLKPIKKAIKYEMKDFVTSDNSQLALIYIQKGSMFRRLKGFKGSVVQVLFGMLFPVLSMAFLIAPQSSFGCLMKNPTIKFWCWVISEVVFVIMLLVNTILMQTNTFKDLDAISPLLVVAYFWVLGKFIQEIREVFHQGLREYLSDVWNWNDLFTILLYTCFMILRIVHIIQNNGDLTRGTPYWHETMFQALPLSDICIAVSYILIHMRIMELLRAARRFGPLQVSLDLMLHDAIRFAIIFGIIFLAFGSGITELYTPYGENKNCSCNSTTVCNASLPLVQLWVPSPPNSSMLPACVSCKKTTENIPVASFTGALISLFWTMFGYDNPQQWYNIAQNCPSEHLLQSLVGAVIIGLYHFGAIIVLVNMLIAMMSNSFQKTHDDSEREWKFHRTQLWLKFIRNEINRPPPMNLIPRWKQVKRCYRFVAKLFSSLFSSCRSTNEEITDFSEEALRRRSQQLNLQRRRTGVEQTLPGGGTLFEGESRYSKVLRLVVLRYVKKKVLHNEMVI
uniref:short transient receptor potential channel 4-like isoform X2 n=1 Tax=Ciona intestinalis TaxID=7719 RepID=UPI00089DD4D6|nr:short transient receptor potential channel 4-like isoform X2 [Ciona intestinalis]|eukprot:XP_018669083.1 short transient receptor potential channel 4-like isoform X2 [Ciona intestinalis]